MTIIQLEKLGFGEFNWLATNQVFGKLTLLEL